MMVLGYSPVLFLPSRPGQAVDPAHIVVPLLLSGIKKSY
jgi:hypothetical protein